MPTEHPYEAVLLVSFGGPEGPEDVMPFLENVTRGKNVPRERLLAVAEHYEHFGGKSPINDHCRALIEALQAELRAAGHELPVYWGNRNWHPLLADTLAQMRDDGITRAVALMTSAFSSYSGCRQYLEDIERARAAVGAGAPAVDKVRGFYNHPGFLGAVAEKTRAALASLGPSERRGARLLFTAHSIPVQMAKTCAYEAQLREASAWVAAAVGEGAAVPHELVYQSRSGPPQVPWLEPDVLDHLDAMAARGDTSVVLVPIGFLSDHVEVLWDLDNEARERAEQLGLAFARAETVGTHPEFVRALRELIEERQGTRAELRVVDGSAVLPTQCAPGCCAYTPGRPGGARPGAARPGGGESGPAKP